MIKNEQERRAGEDIIKENKNRKTEQPIKAGVKNKYKESQE